MLSPVEIREHLRNAAEAAFRPDDVALEEARAWLESAPGRDLLRIDGFARQYRYDGSTLGKPQRWTRQVLERTMAAAALASMHPDGFIRERAVRKLATSEAVLSDRMIALRAGDHVAQVRKLAIQALLGRTSLEQAARITPVLHRFEGRDRGAEARSEYVETLIAIHGDALVWKEFRASTDRDLRRTAFRRSLELDLLDTSGAVEQLPRERDQVVRRLLAQVVADNAEPSTVRAVLLNARSAESRALGLVRLEASQLDPADLEPLLVDSSVLVRLWARRRWQEVGRDAVTAYREATRSAPRPAKRALAYVGLTETGTVVGRTEVLELVHNTEPALQKVGLQLLKEKAKAEDAPELFELFRSNHSRVARLAGDVLARNPGLWTVSQLAELRSDPDPGIRRRGWWLHRSRRGWEALIADLEMLSDPDPRLANLGRLPTAPMYLPPSEAQRERVAELLPDAPINRDQKLGVALAAGLNDLMLELRSAPRWPATTEPAALGQPRSWWQRILTLGRET